MPGIPQKPMWAVTRIIQFQKLAKKQPVKTKYILFLTYSQ